MLIGVCGKKRSGKNTVVDHLVRRYGFIPYSFASPIKKALKTIFNWTDKHIEGELKEVIDPRWGISPRQAMQYTGTEFGQFGLCKAFPEFDRVTGRKLWANRLKYWYESFNEQDDVDMAISDLRFPHEAEVIRELEGIIWRVDRPGLDNSDSHASEIEMDNIVPDSVIINDGTIEDIENFVDSLMEETYVR